MARSAWGSGPIYQPWLAVLPKVKSIKADRITQTANASVSTGRKSYPLLMGMGIGAHNYHEAAHLDALARHDWVVLAFYPGWSSNGLRMPDVLRLLKSRNPRLVIGQYTILCEAFAEGPLNADSDKARKLSACDWWLRDASGQQLKWDPTNAAWDVNFTDWTKPDANGLRYPQWLARRDHEIYFRDPEACGVWYFDNVWERSYVKSADWRQVGMNVSNKDPEVVTRFRQGHVQEWEEARRLAPSCFLVGNINLSLLSELPEYQGRLNGCFLEGLMGLSWSADAWGGWARAMRTYQEAMTYTLPPHLVSFNVHGQPDDYRLMRYGLASCLMHDGYFSYTNIDKPYAKVEWFDEFDQDLGEPVDPPQYVPWDKGAYKRLFSKGLVLVNPGDSAVSLDAPPGFARFKGTQAPAVNTGQPVQTVSLPPRDGLLLVKR